MRTPTFFILGAAKCGTTALAHFISSHPDVFITDPKEPYFFDGNYQIGIDNYLSKYYSERSGEHAAGEATPSYLTIPYVAERIKKNFPDIKLIVLLRNPIERAYSSWWMLYARGMETLSFEDAIDNETIESDYTEEAVHNNILRVKAGKEVCIRNYLYTGHYADHLERFYQYFPKQNIKIVFSSQLRKYHEQSIRDIWDYIGVDASKPIPSPNAVNEALGDKSIIVLKMFKRIGLMPARHILPAGIKLSLKKYLSRMGSRPEMRPETRAQLLDYFTPHIQKLELLIDEDLSDWMI